MNLFVTCPIGCKEDLIHSGIFVAEGELYQCPNCGQLLSSCSKKFYTNSNQSWNTEEGTWPSKNDYGRLKKRRATDINILAKLLNKKYSEIRLLDVGSSSGSCVAIANDMGINAEGVDPSERAVAFGIRRGLKLHKGYLEEIAFSNNSFDAITIHEVIEHVSDPYSLLKECRRILAPDGVLVIGTGNTNSWTMKFRKNNWDFFDMNLHGGHISFFSPKSLKILASNVGFEVKKIRTYSVKFKEKDEVPYFFYRLIKIFTELLNLPAKILGKGHQLEAYLKPIK
jgi:2-polyprenyl-3-methyl-5-hydroxy-6-metoxy-1,4-benzoquinol methylase